MNNRFSTHKLPAAVGRVRDALQGSGLDSRTDSDLLERFGKYADHPAFEVLLRRYGPMVYSACRRMLVNPADVDDAFQATFLVLIRRVRSVRGERLGPWLYGVAFRVALKARGRAARVAARQTEVTDMIPDPTASADPPDWLPALDAELNALPAKYREPMVLCELQGATRADAAKALGVPEGTLSSRLARGRQLLRKRLLRHGTLLPAGGLVSLLGVSGSGRATVPALLYAKAAELAAMGRGAVGMVPAGPARLTDEVLKEMLLMKLRTIGGMVLAAGLMAVGLVAAWPGEAPGQPAERKTAARAAEAPPDPKKAGKAGPARPDQEAVQGLWVLEKLEVRKSTPPEARREYESLNGKARILVAGDVWWWMGPDGRFLPHKAELDPTKNPKWLDLTTEGRIHFFPARSIYQLDGDRLRVCIAEDSQDRPAEFAADDDSPLAILHFRREPLPPPVGEKSLVGSWEAPPHRFVKSKEEFFQHPGRRVEILDGFLFTLVPQEGYPQGVWIGGRYTVDTTKNPKWIDVDLVGAYPNAKVTKLHGSYEVEAGLLKLGLGLTGQRVFRPLDLDPAAGVQIDRLVFELRPATTSPVDQGSVNNEVRLEFERKPATTSPVPVTISSVNISSVNQGPAAKETGAALPTRPLEIQYGDAPRPLCWSHPKARELMREGKFTEAEAVLRDHLRSAPEGPEAAFGKVLLGVCLIQEVGRWAQPPASDEQKQKNREAALQQFKQVVAEVDARRQAGRAAGPDPWLRTQAALRTLQTYQILGQPAEVLAAGEKYRPEVAGTADELIVLSLMYHAYKQQNKPENAFAIRNQMREVFAKLKDKPNAFWAKEAGEYSQKYWETVWFSPDPPTR